MIRSGTRSILKTIGMLATARWLRRWATVLVNSTVRGQEQARRRAFQEFRRSHGMVLAHRLNVGGRTEKKALVVSVGSVQAVGAEIGLLKGLELAGYSPVVLSPPDPWLVRHYRLAGVEEVLFWDDFVGGPNTRRAEEATARMGSLRDLLELKWEGVRVGRFAASTALRSLRAGSLEFTSPHGRKCLLPFVASAMSYATAAMALIQKVKPQLVVFVDRGYTPDGELFDVCLGNGIDVITWNAAHKDNAIMIKRYTRENRDEHPASLSAESWEWMQGIEWSEAHRQRLFSELRRCYATGEWYSEVGTQFKTRITSSAEVRNRLGLQGERKTAVIFPHILWDGTFFYGRDLFDSYEEWFVETVRAACENTRVNWAIKVHPGNIVKGIRDGFKGEPSELKVLGDRIGRLPKHIRVLEADSDISTFSLLGVTDYCVTVRGTVGIEAASLGIPVLTAGTGRYDRKGFTVDSSTREEYLHRVMHIDDIPSPLPGDRELAERFAYAIFLLRPLILTTVTLEYQRDARATPRTRIKAMTREDWLKAPDLRAFAQWVAKGKEIDFLAGDPVSCCVG